MSSKEFLHELLQEFFTRGFLHELRQESIDMSCNKERSQKVGYDMVGPECQSVEEFRYKSKLGVVPAGVSSAGSIER